MFTTPCVCLIVVVVHNILCLSYSCICSQHLVFVLQLFVRIYTLDNSCKSILVDETMTIAQICDILVVKNHYKPNVHWSVVEELTEIYMGELRSACSQFRMCGKF